MAEQTKFENSYSGVIKFAGTYILQRVLVGAAGFEPTNDGIKNRCLTTWRRPKE